jgi:dinuclear metal center YbgI/SA1388 family protein
VRISEIYSILDILSPFEYQEGWDNSGLLIGSPDDLFDSVYVCLDLSLDLVDEVQDGSLIITHHPILFSAIKRLNFDDLSSKLIKALIKKDIKLISLHTNFDKTHLNRYVASEILDFQQAQCDEELLCYAKFKGNIEALYDYLASKLDLKAKKITYAANHQKESLNIALCTGSGMSLLKYIDVQKCDCFLTGDIKYHDANEAIAKGISLIDIGHYESEKHFQPLMCDLLNNELKQRNINNIEIIPLESNNPFS